MKFLIDSYAWIEYLIGSEKGKRVRQILSENNEVYTLDLMIAEVVSKVERENGNSEIAYQSITQNAKIIELSSEIAKQSGIFHAQIKKQIRDFGLVDCILITTAKKLNAKVVTGDKHFKTFKEVVLL